MKRGLPRTGALLAAALVAPAGPISAQEIEFRGELRAGGTFTELRPLVRDSLPESDVAGDGLRRRLADGTIVTCVPDEFCRWYGSGTSEMFSIVTQDLRLSAWGLVPGLSARAHVRGRFGSDEFWPGTTERFEAVTAYLDYDRGDFRARAGRIARADGLGYYNFDGASLLWRGPEGVWAEAYGGWSLAVGLNAPRSGDRIEAADDLPPDDRGLLLGVQAGGRLGPVSATVAYQRDIRTDLLAIYSERVAVDLRALWARWGLDATAEYDWAGRNWNEVGLRATGQVTDAIEAGVEGRHYEPFFESWTIWGAFTPVGFNEARASVAWLGSGLGLRIEAFGAYRDYEDTGASAEFLPLREDGWRIGGSVAWQRDGWSLNGAYRAEAGFGAARFGGDVSAAYTFGAGRWVSIRGSRTQTFGELRLNEEMVSGVGADVAWRVGFWSLVGGGSLYRLDGRERPADADRTQSRLHAGIAVRFGREPGGAAGGAVP